MANLLNAPTPSLEDAQRRVAKELSQGSQLHSVLFLVGSGLATVALASLWLTEQGLPPRTQIAFGLMTAIGLAWTLLFAWILTRRRLLFAYHRVIAGRMAFVASAAFAVGALWVALKFPELGQAALLAGITGAIMALAAALLLRNAKRRHRDLLQLRGWLEAQLGDALR